MLDRELSGSNGWLWLLIAGGALLLLVATGVAFWRLQLRRRKDIDRRLREACSGVLGNFVIPDGNGEQIQVQ